MFVVLPKGYSAPSGGVLERLGTILLYIAVVSLVGTINSVTGGDVSDVGIEYVLVVL